MERFRVHIQDDRRAGVEVFPWQALGTSRSFIIARDFVGSSCVPAVILRATCRHESRRTQCNYDWKNDHGDPANGTSVANTHNR
jgi:hypothetical protein